VSMVKASGVKRYIASTLWCLGVTYGFLGEFYAAYDHVHEAFQLFNTLLPGDRELQRLNCRCGIDLVYEARSTFQDGDKAVSLARDIEKQSAAFSDDLTHAQSLIALGSVLEVYGYRQEALCHLERAKLMVMGSTILLSDACYSIALVHYRENRILEALDTAKEAWKLADLNINLVMQARNSLLLGVILFSANQDAEAWKLMEISLMKNSHLGSRRDSATVLEYMGYGYLRRGDYRNAYGAYEAALENYRGTVDEEPDGTMCKNNMAKIKDKEGNPDLNVGFERPRMDNDWESLYYPVVQDISQ
jgi:tetratricopeptide (TPR) repeat protein